MLLFFKLNRVILVTIRTKPLQQYFHMVLFIYYIVPTFESVDEILWCYYSNETSSAVLSVGVIYLVCSSMFWVYGRNEACGVIFQMKTSWAVRSQDAMCITFIKWNNCNFLLIWFWSLLGVSERAKKLRLKFDELSTIQIRTSTERLLPYEMMRLY